MPLSDLLQECIRLCNDRNEELPQDLQRRIVARADADQNGRLKYAEFERLVCHLCPIHTADADETVLSRRHRWCEHNSQHATRLAHDDCRRIRSTILETGQTDSIAFDCTNFNRLFQQ